MTSKSYFFTKNLASAFDLHGEMILNFLYQAFGNSFKTFTAMLKMFKLFFTLNRKVQSFVLHVIVILLLLLHCLGFSFVKLTLIKAMQTIKLKFVGYKEMISKFFSQIIQNRFYIYTIANCSIISTVITFDRNDFFCLSFKGLHHKNYSVNLVTNFILIKLDQYYTFNEIVFPLVRKLMKQPTILGLRFIVAGRLDRTERAIYLTQSRKSVPLTEKSANIDYAEEIKILRYGVIGIKFWLNLFDFLPSYYKLKFLINLLLFCLDVRLKNNYNLII